ncbi:hypothetical protein BGZ54_006875 [Gamsiella multidivaricata]|nr:hypothetical protein BGZ54_006875 [Gamsiella multidivaricata]
MPPPPPPGPHNATPRPQPLFRAHSSSTLHMQQIAPAFPSYQQQPSASTTTTNTPTDPSQHALRFQQHQPAQPYESLSSTTHTPVVSQMWHHSAPITPTPTSTPASTAVAAGAGTTMEQLRQRLDPRQQQQHQQQEHFRQQMYQLRSQTPSTARTEIRQQQQEDKEEEPGRGQYLAITSRTQSHPQQQHQVPGMPVYIRPPTYSIPLGVSNPWTSTQPISGVAPGQSPVPGLVSGSATYLQRALNLPTSSSSLSTNRTGRAGDPYPIPPRTRAQRQTPETSVAQSMQPTPTPLQRNRRNTASTPPAESTEQGQGRGRELQVLRRSPRFQSPPPPETREAAATTTSTTAGATPIEQPINAPPAPSTAPTISEPAEESRLPPQAPFAVQSPHDLSRNTDDMHDIHMSSLEDDLLSPEGSSEPPIEVTLNIDIPKRSSPAAAGDVSATVLSVNPSWHCIFIEQVHDRKIRTAVRVQFCPSIVGGGGTSAGGGTSRASGGRREKVARLKSIQVVGYKSRQVELTRRIVGKRLIERGGILVHLDPSAISYNEASYGFTLCLTTFPPERLSHSSSPSASIHPDEPLPLIRQQNSAYCRRNLKELYYDTISKDVAITVRPSGEVFYAHSVVLESFGFFRALLERAAREAATSTDLSSGMGAGIGIGAGLRTGMGTQGVEAMETNTMDAAMYASSSSNSSNINPSSQYAVDEEGYARPLHPTPPPPLTPPLAIPTLRQRQQRGTAPEVLQQDRADGIDTTTTTRTNRVRTQVEIRGASPNIFRAILHYMYMGHIPTSLAELTSTPTPTSQRRRPDSGRTEAVVEPARSDERMEGPGSNSIATVEREREGTDLSTGGQSSMAAPHTTNFSWRDLYEAGQSFQISGLIQLSKLVLLARLDPELAIQELFEWAYLHWALVPSYAGFLIENMAPAMLRGEGAEDGEGGMKDGGEEEGWKRKSVMWRYHDRCPKFDDIMVVFLKMLNERKETNMLV